MNIDDRRSGPVVWSDTVASSDTTERMELNQWI